MRYLQSIVLHVTEIGYTMKNVGICLGLEKRGMGTSADKGKENHFSRLLHFFIFFGTLLIFQTCLDKKNQTIT